MHKKLKTFNFNYRINNQIRSSELRVIAADGKQIGVMSLSDALNKAHDEELDLIEIAPMAKPPVAKLMELGKFKYEEEKKLQKEKRKAKQGDIKEIRFSPFIAQHDFDTRIERIKEFLAENNKIRLVVNFTYRQLGSKQFAYEVLNRVLDNFKDQVVTDMEPKFLGKNLVMVISPTKKKLSTATPTEKIKPAQ